MNEEVTAQSSRVNEEVKLQTHNNMAVRHPHAEIN